MSAVRVSVVTPTLNAERYLSLCLDSVRDQHVHDLEHLVIDSGSTDATLELARSRPRVTCVVVPGANQTRAINAGLARAQGDIVAWLNADDLYLPDALRTVLHIFDAQPDLEVLFGDCQVIGPDGEPLWMERPGAYNFRRLIRRGNYIAQPAVFFRRRTFEALGELDETLEYAMDYDLWLRLRGHPVQYVPQTFACFRWHPESKSSRSQLQGWREFLKILRKHGGGWTPELVWSYARCLITVARVRAGESISGSAPLRPLTRGT